MQDEHTGAGRLEGKTALISGTAGGQGRSAAVIFAREGARVFGADLDAEGNAETAALLAAEGLAMTATGPVDLADPEQVTAWVNGAVAESGRIDVLYNNAGLPRFAPFAEMEVADYHFTMRNELDVVWLSCRTAWRHLVAGGGGSIVNVGSIAALTGSRGLPQAAHAAAKGAVLALTRQLAAEGGPYGIRVNSVSPGVIATPTVQAQIDSLGDRAPFNGMIAQAYDRKPGLPSDPVRAALFLASDDARWVSGTNLVVDGGATVVI
ncbi:SDR family oxidoreductase [Streptomyces sp. NPDC001982]|uniref:SDR family NAD(P)-dependent oxidoreductase n=1 Tax=Streptomyces sp. NPDC001982 TaxID=3154405 RepID=UPI00332D220F